jgi:hypothetical protein
MLMDISVQPYAKIGYRKANSMGDPIITLHDAARQLEALLPEVQRILDESELLEIIHHQEVADAGAVVDGFLDEETIDAMAARSGWRRYFDAVDALAEALSVVGRDQSIAHLGAESEGLA